MASKKKKSAEALVAQTDPTAPLDGAAFLAAAQKTLKALADDLLARADGSASITEGLKARWAAEQEKRRTGDAYEPWRRRFVVQVGVAWILGCVFARTLEDRRLVDRNRIAGPGAADSVRQFLDLAPHLTEREYLLTVFRELANLRAARDLFDARHNPVWKLGPSAEGAKLLMDLFRGPDAEAPAFRFGQSDTRFLGDLYQDLSDEVRERFALLQTPRFVESFILDQTLEPAIKEFGLDQATIIDPTCGSGHFLLGAFERLVDHRLRAQPGLDVREAAVKALDAVHGADINPYAAAIARFRLVLAFLERGSYARIEDAPELPIRVVAGDSLLHGVGSSDQEDFAHAPKVDPQRFDGELFALDDGEAAKVVMRRRYAAVVGNPPYITVKDPVLRDEYRKKYASAAGKYSLAAPFTERFFELAMAGGFVGTITANSFMKREFGKKLIEDFLKSQDLQLVVNTSGAYIPGHGTPTVLLFARARTPVGEQVQAILAKRGEPTTPEDPAQGLVWRSIVDHLTAEDFDNDFISTARVSRSTLAKHPWSLGGGGAAELKELIEDRAKARLGDMASSIGIVSFTLEDDVYLRPSAAWSRVGVRKDALREMVIGEAIRDWSISSCDSALFPYSDDFAVWSADEPSLRALWPFRTNLSNNKLFGGRTKVEGGLKWYEFGRLTAEKLRTPLSIVFAFVATHNHFVLDRGGKVFNRSAPIIKLPPEATEDDHLALLAYLNSSTAAFFFRQAGHSKGAQGINEGHKAEEWEQFLEYSGALVGSLPIPARTEKAIALARELLRLGTERARLNPLRQEDWIGRDAELEAAMCRAQEELDWHFYDVFGLLSEPADKAAAREAEQAAEPRLSPGCRAFEIALAESGARTAWFARHARAAPDRERAGKAELRRLSVLDRNATIRLLEAPTHKRRWVPRDHDAELIARSRAQFADAIELALRPLTVVSAREIPGLQSGVELSVLDVLTANAVPFLAAFRHTGEGLEKHDAWLDSWGQQRREDEGEEPLGRHVPPKFGSTDYLSAAIWQQRGKLNVPKERFISYPGCESDEDKSPVYGWAGWDHLQRAQALSALYQKRKNEEAWSKDRLTPMLAGLQELVPWLKQWHNEPDPNFGGERLGNFFADFVASECQALGLTLDDLKAWRPPAKARVAAKKRTATKAADDSSSTRDDESATTKPTNKRAKKAASPADDEPHEMSPSPEAIAYAKREGEVAE